MTGMNGDREVRGPNYIENNVLDDQRRLMTALLNHTSLSEVTDAAAPGAPCGPLDEADRLLKSTHCGAYGVESLA